MFAEQLQRLGLRMRGVIPGVYRPVPFLPTYPCDFWILQDGRGRGFEAAVSNSTVGEFYRSFGGV